jgi:hypothetical protein
MERQSHLDIGLPLSISHLYEDYLGASKIIAKSVKTKQSKYFLTKINLAQQYHADKLCIII